MLLLRKSRVFYLSIPLVVFTGYKVVTSPRTGQPASHADNTLDRDFNATAPLQKLVTDITYLPFGQSMLYLSSIMDLYNGEIIYLPFGQSMLYLSSIMDLYNGEIIAYTIGDTQDTSFVLDTLAQLRELPEKVLLHSDQGSVYTSYEYQKEVKEKGITMSMSRKGNGLSADLFFLFIHINF